jgi:hypothetical protein
MNNPGTFDLGSSSITAALNNVVLTSAPDAQGATQPYLQGLDGVLAAALQLNFSYGSGGTKVTAFVQTTLDQGASWIDVWCATFTTASARKVVNLSALTPKTTALTPSDGALADDTVVDGVLGDRWRLKVVSTGVYGGNTSLSGRIVAR